MNDKKICFIMCVNSDMYEDECMHYLHNLKVPEGYEMEVLSIREATSMTGGYNEGMNCSDAKYKVYLHQDVFIINRDFISDILKVFEQKEIGMLGMVGIEKMPESGVMWDEYRIGKLYTSNILSAGEAVLGDAKQPCQEVAVVDGLLIATQYDLPWREDLFDGWDFYDVSASTEFRRAGYKVVVPGMKEPWCLHDDGFVNLKNYFSYRDIFVEEYGDFLKETS